MQPSKPSLSRQWIKTLLQSPMEHEQVVVAGWVRTKRVSKNLAFLTLNDGTTQGSLQVVISWTEGPSQVLWESLKEVHTGCALEVSGHLKPSMGQGQAWEVHAESLTLLGGADPEVYPLQKKGHSLEFLREIGHLRARTNTFGAVFRIRNCLSFAVHRFFQEQGFIWAQTPIISASDCEGAGELFQVTTLPLDTPPKDKTGSIDYTQDFFGKKSFLTVSGQLQGEFLALAMGKVYTFGPTFRAENSNTYRHLSEFWMIEPEVAFADLQANMVLAEDFVRYQLRAVLRECSDELEFLSKQYKVLDMNLLQAVADTSFGHLTYTDAVALLKKAPKKFDYPVEWGKDLQTEHERYLTEEIYKKPVIVTDYPQQIKAFYMRLNDDEKTVAAMDVLVPGIGELIGGSQREERLPFLEKRMKAFNIPTHELEWYLDLRRFGGVAHAGFGLGFERLVMYATGMQNIRDVIMCPRAPGQVAF